MLQLETIWEFRLHSETEPIDMGFVRRGYAHSGWGLVQFPIGSITEGPWIEQRGSAPWVGLYRLETVVPPEFPGLENCHLEVRGARNLEAWADGRELHEELATGIFLLGDIRGNRQLLLCLALHDHPGAQSPIISVFLR